MASDGFDDALFRLAPIRCEAQRCSEPCGSPSSIRYDSGGGLSSFFSRVHEDVMEGELSIKAATSWRNSSMFFDGKPEAFAKQPLLGCRTLALCSQECTFGSGFCQCRACLAAARQRDVAEWNCQKQQQQQHHYVDVSRVECPQTCFPGSYVAGGCSPPRRKTNISNASRQYCQPADITYLQLVSGPDYWPQDRSSAFYSPLCAYPLRRTARGGTILSACQTAKFEAASLRCVAASTSPIPVPYPPRTLQRRVPSVASVSSLDLQRLAEGAGDEAAGARRRHKADFRSERMLRAVMRFYDAARQERAKRPPGKPSDPQVVVVGFDV